MFDRAAETGFAPVRLADAMARDAGFRPLSFASAPHTAPEEPENLDEIGLDDPFALGDESGFGKALAFGEAEREGVVEIDFVEAFGLLLRGRGGGREG